MQSVRTSHDIEIPSMGVDRRKRRSEAITMTATAFSQNGSLWQLQSHTPIPALLATLFCRLAVCAKQEKVMVEVYKATGMTAAEARALIEHNRTSLEVFAAVEAEPVHLPTPSAGEGKATIVNVVVMEDSPIKKRRRRRRRRMLMVAGGFGGLIVGGVLCGPGAILGCIAGAALTRQLVKRRERIKDARILETARVCEGRIQSASASDISSSASTASNDVSVDKGYFPPVQAKPV